MNQNYRFRKNWNRRNDKVNNLPTYKNTGDKYTHRYWQRGCCAIYLTAKDVELQFAEDPVLVSNGYLEPYEIADYFAKLEKLVSDLYHADARSTFYAIGSYCGMTTNNAALVTLAEQYFNAATMELGDWSRSISLLVHYLNRLGNYENLENMQCAWRLMQMGTSIKYLTAALACLLNMDIWLPLRMGTKIEDRYEKYVYNFNLGNPLEPWLVKVDYKYNGTSFDKWYPAYVPVEVKLLHDWKSLTQLKDDGEADHALEILAGIGNGLDLIDLT